MNTVRNKQPQIGFFSNKIKKNEKTLYTLDIKLWMKKTVIQTIICLLILLIVISFKSINASITNNITSEMSYRLNQQFDYKNSYKIAMTWGKRLINKGEEALEAINFVDMSKRQFILPMEGNIIHLFNDIDESSGKTINGIVIEGIEDERVVAVDEGVVIEVNFSQVYGHYIVIKHRGEFVSVYKHLKSSSVKVNAKVAKGEEIGISSDKLLFEVWQRKEPVDPLEYIDIKQINL